MRVSIKRRIVLAIGALAAMFAFVQVGSAAGPIESNENPNQRGEKDTLIGAQERPQYQAGQQPAGQQPGAAVQRVTANKAMAPENLTDHEIAGWLLIGANEEVQMAKLAESHASNAKVRDFAKQMQQAHTKQWQELERFASQGGRAFSSQPTNAHPGQPALEGPRGGLNFLEVQKQIAAECLSTANREMGAKQGAEFDKAYIGSQIGAHYKMIDTCKVLRNYASPELQKLVNSGLQTAEHHVDEAKSLMRSLEQH